MKNTSILAAMVMAVIGAGGIVGSTSGFGTFSSSNGNTAEQNGLFEGHLTVTAKHSDGTVYAYSQTDNTVTNIGKGCVAAMAFGTNSSAASCAGSASQGIPRFTWIALGNGSNVATATTDTALGYQVFRQNASSTFGATSGVGVTNATGTGHAYAVIQTVFTIPSNLSGGSGTGPGNNTGTTFTIHSPTTLTEAGLLDQQGSSAHGGHIFAHTPLSSSVSVNPGDQVTVKYSIAVG
ncbi:MAG: hypothetical protein KGI28_06000 [Thaumarchaeota archaeon]|nr:hypothetical protein [Nitrososphaerota archaeon]